MSRVFRAGEIPPLDEEWRQLTTGQRIARVWELTKLCTARTDEKSDELPLQRSVVRIQRARG
jgi:hypothetical protein